MPDSTGRMMSRRSFLKLSAGAAGDAIAADLISLGVDARGVQPRALSIFSESGQDVPGLCPYRSIGCAQIVIVDPGTDNILDIQANPDFPINQGTLCPKGSATYQLAVNPLRLTKGKVVRQAMTTGRASHSIGRWNALLNSPS